jgi:heme/copper-type cytochrome/quinol oxidase subunit 1
MKLMDMPIFTWTCTWANVLIVASFPILTATLALLLTVTWISTFSPTNLVAIR